jgi:hypothetical protein
METNLIQSLPMGSMQIFVSPYKIPDFKLILRFHIAEMINPPVCSKNLKFIVMGDPALTCLGINISKMPHIQWS